MAGFPPSSSDWLREVSPWASRERLQWWLPRDLEARATLNSCRLAFPAPTLYLCCTLPLWYLLFPLRPTLSNATTSSRKSLIAALESNRLNSVPGPYLLKSGCFTSLCLSFLIYIKFRFLIFVKFRFHPQRVSFGRSGGRNQLYKFSPLEESDAENLWAALWAKLN